MGIFPGPAEYGDPVTVLVGSGSSATSSAARGVADAARQAAAALDGRPCDLAVAFVTGELASAFDAVLDVVDDVLAPAELVGCTASGVVAGAEELTSGPAVVVWAMALGEDAGVEVVTLRAESVDDGIAIHGVPDGEDDEPRSTAVVLLVDPSQLPVDVTLRALERRLPGVPVIGGIASLLPHPDTPLRHHGADAGAAAIALRFRGVDVLPCVSQGARPIGPSMTVTTGTAGAIHRLDGRPAVEALRDAVTALGPGESELIGHGLLLGVAVGSAPDDHAGEAYIVRGLSAADSQTGAIAIAAPVEAGQTVRVHVRDPDSASRDLVEALRLRREAAGTARLAGALAFTCNGRGAGMFGFDDHDAEAIQHELGPLPLAGMVSAGEIGPVGGRPFAHNYTATIAVFLA